MNSKRTRAALTAGKLHNAWPSVLARVVMERRGWALWWRWQLHRLFMVAVLAGRRPPGWRHDLRGVIAARA